MKKCLKVKEILTKSWCGITFLKCVWSEKYRLSSKLFDARCEEYFKLKNVLDLKVKEMHISRMDDAEKIVWRGDPDKNMNFRTTATIHIHIQPNTLQPTSTEHFRILHHSLCVSRPSRCHHSVAVYAPHCTIRWSNVDYVRVMRLIERVELPQGRIVPAHSTAGLINPKINPLTNIDIYLFETAI